MSQWQKKTAAALRDQLTLMGQRKLPANTDGFDDEFDSLRALDYHVRSNRDEFYTASLGSNMSKNRFRDVLPNEGTRVILDPINHRGDGDYVNANYIDGRRLFGVPFVYIATQAPLRSTIGDFWRMVYENNTTFIVMLCAEIEAGKQKSERYWPDTVGEVMALGPLNVVLVNENHRADTVFRTIALRTLEGKERRVHHLQYTRWPDQSIPDTSSGLMEIILALGKSPLSTQTPIVVHCSGGVGRTGVFLTLHIATALFELEQPISVPRIVQYLKYCRSGMVQRKDQFLFCYYSILREMEKMVWSIEAVKHVDQKMIPIPENVAAGRRINEFLPQHPAQMRPDMERSALQPFSVAIEGGHDGSFDVQGRQSEPNHGIRVGTDVAGAKAGGGGARGFTGKRVIDPEDIDGQLEALRAQNQTKRRTLQPSIIQNHGGKDMEKMLPLYGKTPGMTMAPKSNTTGTPANSFLGASPVIKPSGSVNVMDRFSMSAATEHASPPPPTPPPQQQHASQARDSSYTAARQEMHDIINNSSAAGRQGTNMSNIGQHSPAVMPSPIHNSTAAAGGGGLPQHHSGNRPDAGYGVLTQSQMKDFEPADTAGSNPIPSADALASTLPGTSNHHSGGAAPSHTPHGYDSSPASAASPPPTGSRYSSAGQQSDLGAAANDFNSNFLKTTTTRRNDFGML